MTNFNFNGLMSDILPNVYINKITLEGKDSGLAKLTANSSIAKNAHIETGGLWNEDLEMNTGNLKVTYDLFVEILEAGDNIEMFMEDIFKYINVSVVTFKNKNGYKKCLNESLYNTIFNGFEDGSILQEGIQIEPGKWLKPHKDILASSQKITDTINSKISHAWDSGTEQQKTKILQNKIDFFKQQYRHVLPGERVVYKIPVRVVQELQGTTQPDNLAAIVSCNLDVGAIFESFASDLQFEVGMLSLNTQSGRVATEVIIKDGATVKTGMVFFISNNQAHAESTEDEAEALNKKYSSVVGQLWLGGVHKHGDRFMAGNVHDPDRAHPYLEYILADNNRIHDLRQVAQFKKKLWGDAISGNDNIFGGNYINLQSEVKTADFSNFACFGTLLSSIDIKRRIKLFFSIDWGKLIKKHSAVPALLDHLATSSDLDAMEKFLDNYQVPNILSFKLFRKRLNIAHDTTDQVPGQLIYDTYPKVFSFSPKEQLNNIDPTPISGLVPVNVDYGLNPDLDPALPPSQASFGAKGLIRHFSFTDYDIEKISKGVFEYSVEIEIEDPTLKYFRGKYDIISNGIKKLKSYVEVANGNFSNTLSNQGNMFFDPYSGLFNQSFKSNPIVQDFWKNPNEPPWQVTSALTEARKVTELMQDNKSTHDLGGSAVDFFDDLNVKTFLLPECATPDSISTVYELLTKVADNLNSFIGSFSEATLPKGAVHSVHTNPSTGATLESAPWDQSKIHHKSQASSTNKIIKIKYKFDDPTELVNTLKAEAGYEYFWPGHVEPSHWASVYDRSPWSIGLKVLDQQTYRNYSHMYGVRNYFSGDTVSFSGVPYDIKSTSGRYFAIKQGGIHLPKYVVDHHISDFNGTPTEKMFYQQTNNILRYKLGLTGDTKANAYKLGTATGFSMSNNWTPAPDITDQMERIIKEYQTLAFRGIYFPQEQPPAGVDPWKDENNPLPDGAPKENPYNGLGSLDKMKEGWVPWNDNHKNEKLLLNLINGTYISPSTMSLKLGVFDPAMPMGVVAPILLKFSNPAHFYENLPYQILALLANFSGNKEVLQPDYRYYASGGGVYEDVVGKEVPEGKDPIKNKNMFVDKFGQFWINHMNVGEVQYLAGYGQTQEIPEVQLPEVNIEDKTFFGSIYPSSKQQSNTKKYENVFNSSVKAPYWRPLNSETLKQYFNKVDSQNPKSQRQLLCKIVRPRFEFFDEAAYDVLDMDLFDRYFLITSHAQRSQSNAFLESEDVKEVTMEINPQGNSPYASGAPPMDKTWG